MAELTDADSELLAAEAEAVTYHVAAANGRAVTCWCRAWHVKAEASLLNQALSAAFRAGYIHAKTSA